MTRPTWEQRRQQRIAEILAKPDTAQPVDPPRQKAIESNADMARRRRRLQWILANQPVDFSAKPITRQMRDDIARSRRQFRNQLCDVLAEPPPPKPQEFAPVRFQVSLSLDPLDVFELSSGQRLEASLPFAPQPPQKMLSPPPVPTVNPDAPVDPVQLSFFLRPDWKELLDKADAKEELDAAAKVIPIVEPVAPVLGLTRQMICQWLASTRPIGASVGSIPFTR